MNVKQEHLDSANLLHVCWSCKIGKLALSRSDKIPLKIPGFESWSDLTPKSNGLLLGRHHTHQKCFVRICRHQQNLLNFPLPTVVKIRLKIPKSRSQWLPEFNVDFLVQNTSLVKLSWRSDQTQKQTTAWENLPPPMGGSNYLRPGG